MARSKAQTQAFPLSWPDGWPRKNFNRDSGQKFGTGLDIEKAVRGLYDELGRLGAKNIVVSSNIEPRIGGALRSRPTNDSTDTGVAVYFDYKDRPMVMAQDGYYEVKHNIRSLTLAIDAMRALERHGGGHMMERAFAGFTALPPPSGGYDDVAAKPWREVLDMPDGIGGFLGSADILLIAERRYREKSKDVHSDHGGAGDAAMILLNAAIAQARTELKS